MEKEIDSFIEAQNFICEKLPLNIGVFMATNENLPTDKK